MPRRGSAADLSSSSFLDPSVIGIPAALRYPTGITYNGNARTDSTGRERGRGRRANTCAHERKDRTTTTGSAAVGRRVAATGRRSGSHTLPCPPAPQRRGLLGQRDRPTERPLARVPRRVGELNGGLRCGSNQAHQVADASRNPRCEFSGSPFSSKRCLSRVAPINQQKMTLFSP